MKSIPASRYVSVVPSVLGTGGNPLALNGVMVDNSGDTSIPIGTVQAFTLDEFASWYGANAIQTQLADFYFGGFLGANSLPETLYVTQYNAAPVAGYLRGGVISGISLATLQGYSGSLTIVIDGVSHVSDAIDLSSATSFSNAATLITAGLAAGTPASTAVCSYDALRGAFVITSPTTGGSSSVAFPTTATLATDLLLTAAKGAVLSAGAAAATPAGAMNAVVAVTQNWVTFSTVVDPDAGAEPATVKLAFAAWVSTQSPAGSERFAYAGWDADPAPAASTSAAASFGAAVTAAGYNGVVPIWDIASAPSAPGVASTHIPGSKAFGWMGAVASIDYTETQGRITFDFKNFPGAVADVVSDQVATNLTANGYNFYGTAGTANQQFTFFQPGSMPGSWRWADDYIDQVWLNNALQLALMSLLTTVKSVPYNNAGYALLRAACMDPINAAVNAGVIQAGVPLSAAQAQEVNTAAGVRIDGVLSTQGWYLQILPASAIVRGNRQSPPMTLWYTDGGSVQQVTLASIDVQ